MTRAMPFWFTKDELNKLKTFLGQEELVCDFLDELRLEMDIAELRVPLISMNLPSLSRALGFSQGAVPVYLNDLEKEALLDCTDLPLSTREVLS